MTLVLALFFSVGLASGEEAVIFDTDSLAGTGTVNRSSIDTCRDGSEDGTNNDALNLVRPAILTVTPAFHEFGSHTVGVGPAPRATFKVENTGGTSAMALSIGGIGPHYTVVSNTCVGILAPVAACTFEVEFRPTAPGDFGGDFHLSFNNGAGMIESARGHLSGVGLTSAELKVVANTSTNPWVACVGLSSLSPGSRWILFNTGQSSATLVDLVPPGAPFSVDRESTSCGSTIAGGASCEVVYRFSPTSEGQYSAVTQVQYSDGTAPGVPNRSMIVASFQAGGLAPGDLTIMPQDADFGPAAVGGLSAPLTFTVVNSGECDARVNGISTTAPELAVTGGTCGNFPALAGTWNGSPGFCSIIATYNASALGSQRGELRVDSFNGAADVSTTSRLRGTGIGTANLLLDAAAGTDFGSHAVGSASSRTRPFLLDNLGTAKATAVGIHLAGAPGAFSVIDTCPAAIPGAIDDSPTGCGFTIEFHPPSPGLHTATLHVTYFDGAHHRTTETLTLRGNATGVTAGYFPRPPERFGHSSSRLQPFHEYARLGRFKASF